QKARAALLLVGKQAALSHWSAGFLHGLTRDEPNTIDVSVSHRLKVQPSAGIVIHRVRRTLTMTGNPHRTTLVETALDLVDTAEDAAEVLEVLTQAVWKGADPKKLLNAAAGRRYLGNRGLLRELLAEFVEGVESELERRFLTNVVRAHGLPEPVLQARTRIRDHWVRSDCWFDRHALRVELDGELAHPGRATGADVLRDNDMVLSHQEITLRYRWWHTLMGSCVSAAQVAAGLWRGGFEGEPQPCSDTCTAPAEFRKLIAHGGAGARRRR
ncbi:MAG: type IV toxin-antitoxin system AbiEi family antitoxin domain-containing protein, partial [Actinomycetota bacterium]